MKLEIPFRAASCARFFCRPCPPLKIMDVGEVESEKANQIQSCPLGDKRK